MIKEEYRDILQGLSDKAPRKKTDDILIIDSLNTFVRSFSTIRSLNPKGNHVGGMVGFLRSLGYLVRTFNPTWVICVFDGKGSSISRKNINPNYKSQRDGVKITNWDMFDTKAEEVKSFTDQIERLKDYLETLPVTTVTLDKLEADDVIAFIAQKLSKNEKKCTIVSSDKDFWQIIDKNISVYAPIKKTIFKHDNILDTLKVLPINYLLVKALIGDNSDNLRGVKGAGFKTIINFFPELTTRKVGLQEIYDISEKNINKRKLFARIVDDWNLVETNYKLMSLQEIDLDKSYKKAIFEQVTKDVPKLHSGAFLHYLDKDGIEGITKNTDSWLETFRSLTLYKE